MGDPILPARAEWAQWPGIRPPRSQSVEVAEINGRACKRVLLRDSFLAAAIESDFDRFGRTDLFPRLLLRFENELWMELVDGRAIDEPVDGKTARAIADFFIAVHTRDLRCVPMADTVFLSRARRDLDALSYLGVLSGSVVAQLDQCVQRLVPQEVWVGFDYLDPTLRNFVLRGDDSHLMAVDLESLRNDQLIGTGIAKACVTWLGDGRSEFLARIETGLPGFGVLFPFAELAFLARWTKRMFVEGNLRAVDPALFDRFLG